MKGLPEGPPATSRRTGVAASLGAALAFAGAALLVKISSERFSILDILWVRGLLQIVFMLAALAWARTSPWGPRELRCWLLLRGLLGVGSIIGYFFGIVVLPIADCISIYSMKPIFASVLGALFLSEAFQRVHVLAAVCAVSGCILVAYSHKEHAHSKMYAGGVARLPAVCIVLVSATLAAATTVVLRRIMSRSTVAANVVVWYFCVVDLGVLCVLTPLISGSSVAARPKDLQPSLWHIAAVVGVSGLSVLGQQLMSIGLRHVSSAVGALLIQTETVFAFVIQALVYGGVSMQSVGGAALITFGTLGVSWVELREGGGGFDKLKEPKEKRREEGRDSSKPSGKRPSSPEADRIGLAREAAEPDPGAAVEESQQGA